MKAIVCIKYGSSDEIESRQSSIEHTCWYRFPKPTGMSIEGPGKETWL